MVQVALASLGRRLFDMTSLTKKLKCRFQLSFKLAALSDDCKWLTIDDTKCLLVDLRQCEWDDEAWSSALGCHVVTAV